MNSQCATVNNNDGLSFASFCVARSKSLKTQKKIPTECVDFEMISQCATGQIRKAVTMAAFPLLHFVLRVLKA